MGRRLTYEEVKDFIEVESDSGCKVLTKIDEYKNTRSVLHILCSCKERFASNYDKFKHSNKRHCNECGYLKMRIDRKHSYEKVLNIFYKNNLTPIFEESEYNNNNSKLSFICNSHKEVGLQHTTYAMLNVRGRGCNHCVNEMMSEKFREKNPTTYFYEKDLIPLFTDKEYINSSQKLPFNCIHHKKHGTQFVDLEHLKNREQGCIYCSSKISKPEKIISKLLYEHYKVNNQYQYSFLDDSIKKMRFDFYISNDKSHVLVEYDGEQHFRRIFFRGMKEITTCEQLKQGQYRDMIKNQYCIDNNIPLIRIPYWEKGNIEYILNNVLAYFNIHKTNDIIDTEIVERYLVDSNWDHNTYLSWQHKENRYWEYIEEQNKAI